MTMTSIKIKFRPSSVEGKEGGIFFQIIHNRVVRQLNTDYRVFASEWDAEAECIIVNENRSATLCNIKERLEWDYARLKNVIRQLENDNMRFTADDVITAFHRLTKEMSLFNFMHSVIAQLKQLGKVQQKQRTCRCRLSARAWDMTLKQRHRFTLHRWKLRWLIKPTR